MIFLSKIEKKLDGFLLLNVDLGFNELDEHELISFYKKIIKIKVKVLEISFDGNEKIQENT